MKKILSVIMVVAMLVTSILPAVANVAAADATVSFVLSDTGFVEDEESGLGKAEVAIEIENNPGITEFAFVIYYTNTDVSVDSFTAPDGLEDYITDSGLTNASTGSKVKKYFANAGVATGTTVKAALVEGFFEENYTDSKIGTLTIYTAEAFSDLPEEFTYSIGFIGGEVYDIDGKEYSCDPFTYTYDVSTAAPDPWAPVYDVESFEDFTINLTGTTVYEGIVNENGVPTADMRVEFHGNNVENNPFGVWGFRCFITYPEELEVIAYENGDIFKDSEMTAMGDCATNVNVADELAKADDDDESTKVADAVNFALEGFEYVGYDTYATDGIELSIIQYNSTMWYDVTLGDGILQTITFQLPEDAKAGDRWDVKICAAATDVCDNGGSTPDDQHPELNPSDVLTAYNDGYIKVARQLPQVEEETFDSFTLNAENKIVDVDADTVTIDLDIYGNSADVNPYGFWGFRAFVYYPSDLVLAGVEEGKIVPAGGFTVTPNIDLDELTATSPDNLLVEAAPLAFEEAGFDYKNEDFIFTCIYFQAPSDAQCITKDGNYATLTFELPEGASAGDEWYVGLATCTANADVIGYLADPSLSTTVAEILPHSLNDGYIKVYCEAAPEECKHTNTDTTVVESTCVTAGSETVVCADCGVIISVVELPLADHVEGEAVVVESTCTVAGTSTVSCAVCGEALYSVDLPLADHTPGEKVTILEPTYDAAGQYVISCSVCGAEIEVGEIPALTKSNVTVGTGSAAVGEEVTVAVTMADNEGLFIGKYIINYDAAVLSVKSIENGDVFAADNVIFNADVEGQIVLYFESNSNADVTANGVLANITFAIANNAAAGDYELSIEADAENNINYEGEEVEINAVAGKIAVLACQHPATTAIVTKLPSVYEEGVKEFVCDVCGEVVDTEAIAKLAGIVVTNKQVSVSNSFNVPVSIVNNPGVWSLSISVAYDADLLDVQGIEPGLFTTDEYSYSVADGVITIYVESETLENIAEDGVAFYIDFEAIASGECVLETKLIAENTINAASEAVDFVIVDAKVAISDCQHDNVATLHEHDATCTEEGYTGDIVCNDCGEVVEYGEVIPALGHVAGDKVVTVEPTYETEGVYEIACTVCGEVLETGSVPVIEKTLVTVGTNSVPAGEEVSVAITIANNAGLFISKYIVTYDAAVLALKDAVNGDVFAADNVIINTANEGEIILYFEADADADVVLNGTLATLTFVAADKAIEGDYAIEIVAEEGNNINYAGEDVAIDAVSGKITVTECLHASTTAVQTQAPSIYNEGLIEYICDKCGKTVDTEAVAKLAGVAIDFVQTTYGDKLYVPVTLLNNPGVWAMSITIEYDAFALAPTAVVSGLFEADEYSYSVKDGVITIYVENAEIANIAEDGVAFEVEFDTLAEGFFFLDATLVADNTINVDGENVAFEVVDGDALVKCDLIHVEAIDADCHYNGNVEYWYCPECGAHYLDADGIRMTNARSVIIPATGSDNVIYYKAVEPACHYNGNIEYWYCPDCDQYFQDEYFTQITNAKNVILPAVGSENVEHHEAVAPTCTENGNIEFWHCPDCFQFWQDSALTQITNRFNVILPATEHVPGEKIYTEPGYGVDGKWEILCTVCGEVLESEIIPALITPEVSVGTGTAIAGDDVTVDIEIANNSGLFITKYIVKYDASVLTLKDVLNGEVFAADNVIFNTSVEGEIVLYFEAADVADVTANGILASLVFATSADAAYTDYAIEIVAEEGNSITVDGVDVPVIVADGVVTIVECPHINTTPVVVIEPTVFEEGVADCYCDRCGEYSHSISVPKAAGIIIGDTTAPAAGQIVVPVTLANNTGVWCVSIKLAYDAKVLTFKAINSGLFAADEYSYSIADGVITIYVENAEIADITADGTAFELVFGVYNKAAAGEYALDAELVADNTINVDGENVKLLVVDGVVSVTACEHADTMLIGQREATCTRDGFTGNEVCTACGKIVVAGKVIKAAHVPGEEVILDATCTEDGYKKVACTVCGEFIVDEVIPATGHAAGDKIITVEPTLDSEGAWEIRCTVCGEILESGIIAKLQFLTKASGTDYVKSVTLDGDKILVVSRPGAPYVKIAVGYNAGLDVQSEHITMKRSTYSYLVINAGESATIVATDANGYTREYTVEVVSDNIFFTDSIVGYTVDSHEVLANGAVINVQAKAKVASAAVGLVLTKGTTYSVPEGLEAVKSGKYIYFKAYDSAAEDTYVVTLTASNGATLEVTINYEFNHELAKGVQGGSMVGDGIELGLGEVNITVDAKYKYASFRFILKNTKSTYEWDEETVDHVMSGSIHWFKIYNDGTGYVTTDMYITDAVSGETDHYVINVTFE